MFLSLLDWLAGVGCPAGDLSAAGKITFRAALAALVSFALAVALGPRLIGWLARRFREPIKSDSPDVLRLHQSKQSTPTMGGLFIVGGLLAGVLLLADLTNGYVLQAALLTVGLAAVGAVDDLVKLFGRANGLSRRGKLALQLAVAGAAAVLLYLQRRGSPDGLALHVPLLGVQLHLGLLYVPWAVLVIVGATNAVNLTDGLDGLAGGCLIFSTAAMTVLVYVAGHAELAEYLHVPRVAGAGEMTVLGAAMIGGVLGFLWFNCHPAQVFMGDTGALPLGGLLGFMALVAHQELLLVVVGGVFVAEAASVLLQIAAHRYFGRRLFRCAPLHHHYQLAGWPENKIVVRFWIAAALCALLGMAALKLNGARDADGPSVSTAQASTEQRRDKEVPSARRANPESILRASAPPRETTAQALFARGGAERAEKTR